MAAFAPRVGALGMLGLCFALLLSLAAAPAYAGAPGRSLKIALPARGDVAAMTFDVQARRGGAPGRVRVEVALPRALRRRVGVAIVVDREPTLKRFTVYVVNRRPARSATAQSGRVVVRVRGVNRAVSVRNVERARDALANLTDEMADGICTADIDTVRTLFGLRGVGSFALARALQAVLCDTATDEDVQFLTDLGIAVPADGDEFDCTAFAGNPFEAVCQFSGTQVDAVRISGLGGIAFTQCFAGANPCMVDQPGSPNNSVVFRFVNPTDSTGPLNLRALQPYDEWQQLVLERSTDAGQTFQEVERFNP